jgi:hypothetical protein
VNPVPSGNGSLWDLQNFLNQFTKNYGFLFNYLQTTTNFRSKADSAEAASRGARPELHGGGCRSGAPVSDPAS